MRKFLVALSVLASCSGALAAAPALEIADQGYLFAGGKYVDGPDGKYMQGQAYVEYQIPAHRTHPYPIVMIEGGGQSGSNFTGTPDGREGWSQYFLRLGYAVYVVDQPGRGRSAFAAGYGKTVTRPTVFAEQLFTAPERFNKWPQAKFHTQWPGTGMEGDPTFDQFYAEQVQSMTNGPLAQALNRDAVAALLDKIGPAIVLTHSQAGAYGWPIADSRPDLVKAIVAVEPSGPPVQNVEEKGPPDWFADGQMSKPWGLSAVPLAYDGITDASQLSFVRQDKPERPDVVRCWRQAEPAHRLTHLAGIPVVIVTSEASAHVAYDDCTAEYLTQAGVKTTDIHLADRGIHGNGHMMMLEKNNLQVAAVIADWLERVK
jgi:pimeloyl-ACP methyl ester carboxylesterase